MKVAFYSTENATATGPRTSEGQLVKLHGVFK